MADLEQSGAAGDTAAAARARDDAHTINVQVNGDGTHTFEDGAGEKLAHIVEEVLLGRTPADESEPLREVSVTINGADFRATVGRLLPFTATGKDAGHLANLRFAFAGEWMQAIAGDGYAYAIQKMRCEADGEGVLVLSSYDAARIAALVPKPGKDDLTEDLTLTFQVGGAPNARRGVSATYSEAGRVGFHSCPAAEHGPAAPFALIAALTPHEADVAQWAIHPEFMVLVAKAVTAAKDQQPFTVRWHLLEEHPARLDPDRMIPGPLVARFSVAEQHDQFVAIFMPLLVDWTEHDTAAEVFERIQDMRSSAERLRPLPVRAPLEGEDGAAS